MGCVVASVRSFMASWSGQPGVVAVSGGPDSVALLRAVLACGAGPLTVAHVNHQLRGEASDADASFVRDLAAELGLACHVTSVAVATQGGNLEATARRIRYAFFAEVAAAVGATWIATGHTADDQAETVLHRIIRGTGIQGLRGIAACHVAGGPPPHVAIIRPLLTVTRADVMAYLAELGQAFREDQSNVDPRFTRNRIRHDVLPLLRTFNPDVVAALTRLANHAAEASEIITAHAAAVLAQAERPRAGRTVILDATALGSSAAVVRAVLRLVWQREGWPMDPMDADAWDRACAVVAGRPPAWDFPGGIRMRHAGQVVQIAAQPTGHG